MATKSITITVEAYDRLAGCKVKKESFSDVINRLAKRRPLSDLAGLLTEKEAKELKRNIADMRKKWNKEMDERTKRFL